MAFRRDKYLTNEEIEEIINSDAFHNAVSDDQDHIDITICPPEVDCMTDEEEGPDDVIGTVEVSDVPGAIELHYVASENNEETVFETSLPSTSQVSRSKSKKRRLTDEKSNWKKTPPIYTKLSQSGKHDISTKREELKEQISSLTPKEMFEEMMNENIYEFIVKETVRYAVNMKNMQDFILTVEEVKVFIGFLLFAGYHKLPAEKLYWSEDEDVGIPIIKKAMSRNKYQKLKTLLHFQDNDLANENKHDRGFKIRPILKMVNESFQKFGIFEENLSIDEMIVKYYGRSGLKQFIRGKPIRFGYKLWSLCGASGYCFKFDLYCGKDPEDTARDDLLLGPRVVLNMLDCIEKPENHCVYFDNFFTSRDLLIYLRNLGYRATGTVRENRVGDCPLLSSNELKKTARGNYDYQFDRNGEVLFVRWHDNRCVTIGTNFDKVEPLGTTMRYSRQASKKTQVQQPAVLKSYNAYMGGVDHHDWLVGKYATVIRGKKWYWVLFTRMVEMALVNAWLLYRLVHGKNALDLLGFRRAVTVTYLKLDTGRPNIGRTMESPSTQLRVIPDIRFDGIGHMIDKRSTQRRCVRAKCNGKPKTYCVKCRVTLCVKCFVPFHKK